MIGFGKLLLAIIIFGFAKYNFFCVKFTS